MNLAAAWAALWGRKAAQQIGVVDRIRAGGEPPKRGVPEVIAAYNTSPWFRSVTNKIASAVASTPWQLYAGTGRERAEILQHDLLDLLARPNPGMSGPALRKLTQLYIELAGEAFWVLELGAGGVPVELWPAPPNWVRETPSQGKPWFRIRMGKEEWHVPIEDVVWFRDLDPVNPYGRGSGMAMSLADELDTDEYAAKMTKAFFYNPDQPGLLVSAEGMGLDEAKRAKAEWSENHRGVFNAFRSFWTGSKLSVTRLDTSFKDMQLVDLRKFERDMFQQTYGIPPEVMGILANSNRATIESAYYLMATNVMVPRLEFLKAELQAKVLPRFKKGDRLVVEYVSPVPEDRQFKLAVMQSRPQAFSHNEVRKLAGDQPKEGWDEVYPSRPVFQPPATEELPPEEEAKRLPARRKELAASQIDNVLERLRPERLTSELEPVFRRRIESWAKRILRDLGAEPKFDILNPLIPEYLEELSGTKIAGVNGTTRDALRDALTEGVRSGEDAAALSKRVRTVFDVADGSRAESIARTEVVGASNWATYEAHKASGVVEKRQWVATRDGRAREEHIDLDGEERKLGEKFTIGGASAHYPGGFGVAELDINCRCTTVAVIEDPDDDGKAVQTSAIDLDATWKAFDAALQPWESAAKDALRTGFRRQEQDIIDALEELA